jgi:hypothetical protein
MTPRQFAFVSRWAIGRKSMPIEVGWFETQTVPDLRVNRISLNMSYRENTNHFTGSFTFVLIHIHFHRRLPLVPLASLNQARFDLYE